MQYLKSLAIGLAILVVPFLAHAQDGSSPSPSSSQAAAPALAPAQAAPVAATPPNSARLAAARQTVDAIFPAGTYARVMERSLDTLMRPMMDSMGAMPLSSLAGMAGAKSEDMAKLGKGTMNDIMTILDPAYRQRLEITTRLMTTEMSAIMSQVEPGMRDSLSRAYARRFDLAQLGELNRFFATPIGRAYATESMTIMTDPDVMAQMQAFVPALLKRMPEMMARVEAATSNLPKPRKYEELSPAERKRFDALIGETTPAGSTATDTDTQ